MSTNSAAGDGLGSLDGELIVKIFRICVENV
jgi:hypothetical protein